MEQALSSPRFFILGLPRARTYWLSKFLSYGPARVAHDLSMQVASAEDFAEKAQDFTGVVDTGAVIGWRRLVARFPQAKLVAIRRPVEDILDSFDRLGVRVSALELVARKKLLEEFIAETGAMSLWFHDLDHMTPARTIFEHCLGYPWDHRWWRFMREQNLQVNVRHQIALQTYRQYTLTALRQEVQSEIPV